jgi:outer membrane lipoprotein-sorting protein
VKQKIGLKLNILFSLLLVASQAGCIKKTTVVPPAQRLLPAKSATREELMKKLQEQSNQVHTLKATTLLELSQGGAKSGVLEQYRQTKGYVFVERPDHIRIQVQLPILLSTIAIMVSDGQQYRVSIPIKNQFAIRDVNEPVSEKNAVKDLRPQLFLEGLFVDIRPYIDNPNVKSFLEEAVGGVHSYYVFSFFDVSAPEAQLLEKIWIDRNELQIARKQIYGKEGRLETDAEYQNFHSEKGIQVPQLVVIHRPVEDFTVKMTFQQTMLNESLDASIFDLPRPEGSELVQAGP